MTSPNDLELFRVHHATELMKIDKNRRMNFTSGSEGALKLDATHTLDFDLLHLH